MANTESPFNDSIDRVFLVTCSKYRNRLPSMEKELDRVGLLPLCDTIFQYPNPFDRTVLNRVRHIREMEDSGPLNLWFGHYRAMKIGYELGYDRIMVVEDDIRFLKDKQMIRKSVDELPGNLFCAMLDVTQDLCDLGEYRFGSQRGREMGFTRWGVASGDVTLYSTGCYILSRTGMSEMINTFESVVSEENPGTMRRADDYWKPLSGENPMFLYASPRVTLQADFADQKCLGPYSKEVHRRYRDSGINMDDYES